MARFQRLALLLHLVQLKFGLLEFAGNQPGLVPKTFLATNSLLLELHPYLREQLVLSLDLLLQGPLLLFEEANTDLKSHYVFILGPYAFLEGVVGIPCILYILAQSLFQGQKGSDGVPLSPKRVLVLLHCPP